MYKLYSRISDHETVLECWGASTKHPDCAFFFSEFKISAWFDRQDQIVPWILECASKKNFPIHSYEMAKWACMIYEQVKGWDR